MFSVDALISIAVFLIVIIIVFFIWFQALNKTHEADLKKELDSVVYYMSQGIIDSHINGNISSIQSLDQSVCQKYGMYGYGMNCFFDVEQDDGSKFNYGTKYNNKSFTSTISRMIVVDNKITKIHMGVQYDE